MNTLQLRVHVSARAAIVAGKTRVGAQTVVLDEANLGALSEELRFEIAVALEEGPELGTLPNDPPIVEPTLEALKPVLVARAAARKVTDGLKVAAKARAEEEERVAAHQRVSKDKARAKALRAWVEAHGDEDQKARMAEGFLREEEILDDIMDDVFDLGGATAYEPIRRGDACDCPCAGDVQFTVGAPQHMDSRQFSRLKTIRENAPEGATVEPIEHKAKCPSCGCLPSVRITARVSLAWNGWLLARDFSIH